LKSLYSHCIVASEPGSRATRSVSQVACAAQPRQDDSATIRRLYGDSKIMRILVQPITLSLSSKEETASLKVIIQT
jgi:hypothetical protein